MLDTGRIPPHEFIEAPQLQNGVVFTESPTLRHGRRFGVEEPAPRKPNDDKKRSNSENVNVQNIFPERVVRYTAHAETSLTRGKKLGRASPDTSASRDSRQEKKTKTKQQQGSGGGGFECHLSVYRHARIKTKIYTNRPETHPSAYLQRLATPGPLLDGGGTASYNHRHAAFIN